MSMILVNTDTGIIAQPPEIREFSREFFKIVVKHMTNQGFPGGVGSPIEVPLTISLEMAFHQMNQL